MTTPVHSVALIGCGEVAESGHLPAILGSDRYRLVAACDVNPSRVELISTLAGGLRTYTDWRKLLAAEAELDAVILALPPQISPDVAIEAMSLYLPVLDEKPLATSLTDGMRLRQAVHDFAGVYQVGFVLRYGDWVELIRQHIPSLGSPLQINVEVYDEQFDPDQKEHLSRICGFIETSSALTHEGSHVIDYVSRWSPAPWVKLNAVAKQTSPSFGGPNVWDAQIESADNTVLNLKIGWLLPELPDSSVTIIGPEGRLHFDFTSGRGVVENDSGEYPFTTEPLAPQWKRQYETFADAITRGHATVATAEDGLRALTATLACELSAKTGAPVSADQMNVPAIKSRIATPNSLKTGSLTRTKLS